MKKFPKRYKYAVIATDVVIFTIKDNKLQVLLIKMKKRPYTGYWAAPGGLVDLYESVDDSAKRHLLDKTGVKNVYLEQLYTFGEVERDPFGRVVSVAYFALIPSGGVKLETTEEYEDVAWFPVQKLPALAYDHQKIIDVALARLKAKLGYTNIVYSLLPTEFSIGELRETYEIILQKKLDRRNFRKKLISLKVVKKIGKRQADVSNRPAELYQFTSKKLARYRIL